VTWTLRACMPMKKNSLPTGSDAEIMKTFVEIAKKTGQLSEIMNFPPIDHDSPIRYVFSEDSYTHDIEILKLRTTSPQFPGIANTTTQNKFL